MFKEMSIQAMDFGDYYHFFGKRDYGMTETTISEGIEKHGIKFWREGK